VLNQADFEIAFFPVNALDLGEGQQFDIDMPADLDQFRRYVSHCTIVGGKGFIQLRHHTPDGAGFFDEVDQVPRISQIQGCLHSGNTAADHHYCAYIFF
jgi:hypothetical protein